MIDTHCHIDLYDYPIEIVNECEKLGIITIGMTNLPSYFKLGYKHLLNCRKVRLALGMHPLHAEFHKIELPLFLECLDKTSYIGEIGLDFSKEGRGTSDIQIETFKIILDAVKGKNKILSIHSRNAEREVLQYLIHYNIKSAIFHWYSGPLLLIDKIVNAGFYFSVNPAMIKSKKGQEIIKKIPLSSILTESDGPFIQYKGKPIKPSDVAVVITYLSSLWELPAKNVQEKIDSNFQNALSSLRIST